MVNNVLALIDLHDHVNLGTLTLNRPIAVTTFLGRYTFLDFVLSNFTNSGIDDLSILIRDHSRNIAKHISRNSVYLKNSKTGNLNLLMNEKALLNPEFNTDINNILENDYVLYDNQSKYVIITPVHFVYRANYQEILDAHIKSGRVVSLLYYETQDAKQFSNCEKLTIDAIGDVQKFDNVTDKDMGKTFDVNLGCYIMNRSFFNELINKCRDVSLMYSISDMVHYISRFIEKVNCIKFNEKVLCFNSLEKYLSNSMYILEQGNNGSFLLDKDNPTYTKTHFSRPVLYGPKCNVSQSLVANGSTINGTVKNSILARDILVEEGAIVENSIIFSHTIVRKGVHLNHVVANKRCVFKSKKEIIGTDENPIYIPGGSNI